MKGIFPDSVKTKNKLQSLNSGLNVVRSCRIFDCTYVHVVKKKRSIKRKIGLVHSDKNHSLTSVEKNDDEINSDDRSNEKFQKMILNNEDDGFDDNDSDASFLAGVMEYNDVYSRQMIHMKSVPFHHTLQNSMMTIVLSNWNVTQLACDDQVQAPEHIFCITGDVTLYSEICYFRQFIKKLWSLKSLILLLPQGWRKKEFQAEVLNWLDNRNCEHVWEVTSFLTNYSTASCKDIRTVSLEFKLNNDYT